MKYSIPNRSPNYLAEFLSVCGKAVTAARARFGDPGVRASSRRSLPNQLDVQTMEPLTGILPANWSALLPVA